MVVGGVSGSGKSTLARALATLLDAPYVELDAHFHGPGWTETPDDEFVASVAAATAGDRWIVDGNYTRVRETTWGRATDFVWLDYPRHVATLRTVRRTARRLALREELWNGNRERFSNLLHPEHPIRWSWSQHPGCRAKYEEATADPRWSHIRVVRLRSPKETEAWLTEVRAQPPA